MPCATGAARSAACCRGDQQVGERLERKRPRHSSPARPRRYAATCADALLCPQQDSLVGFLCCRLLGHQRQFLRAAGLCTHRFSGAVRGRDPADGGAAGPGSHSEQGGALTCWLLVATFQWHSPCAPASELFRVSGRHCGVNSLPSVSTLRSDAPEWRSSAPAKTSDGRSVSGQPYTYPAGPETLRARRRSWRPAGARSPRCSRTTTGSTTRPRRATSATCSTSAAAPSSGAASRCAACRP